MHVQKKHPSLPKIPLFAQSINFGPKYPICDHSTQHLTKIPISALDEHLRQLCGRRLSVGGLDPTVDDGEEQGHQEVP